MNTAYLEINVGPMFSGKTTKLIEYYQQFRNDGIPTVCINHASDVRYSNTMVSSHDRVMVPCIHAEKLSLDIKQEIVNNNQVFLINEAQFFDDLESFVIDLLEKKKQVYIFGLDGDFERKKFGYMLDLIPLCDQVYKLNALCKSCDVGNKGIFSKRITSETSQVLVGSDNYIPVCRNCYN